jgi:hypothetical protein
MEAFRQRTAVLDAFLESTLCISHRWSRLVSEAADYPATDPTRNRVV